MEALPVPSSLVRQVLRHLQDQVHRLVRVLRKIPKVDPVGAAQLPLEDQPIPLDGQLQLLQALGKSWAQQIQPPALRKPDPDLLPENFSRSDGQSAAEQRRDLAYPVRAVQCPLRSGAEGNFRLGRDRKHQNKKDSQSYNMFHRNASCVRMGLPLSLREGGSLSYHPGRTLSAGSRRRIHKKFMKISALFQADRLE